MSALFPLAEAHDAAESARRNDAFRTTFGGEFTDHGMLVFTRRLSATSWDFRSRVLDAVRSYNDFTEDNDPYGEHDLGIIEIDGTKLFWKIDHYATAECFEGAEPLNPNAFRVLTIMYPEEF